MEIAAAFAGKLRGRSITQARYSKARRKLEADTRNRYQVLPITPQRIDDAIDLTTRHKLRGYDAVHLACALRVNQILLADNLPPLILVAADHDLVEAARAEGLSVEDPNLHP